MLKALAVAFAFCVFALTSPGLSQGTEIGHDMDWQEEFTILRQMKTRGNAISEVTEEEQLTVFVEADTERVTQAEPGPQTYDLGQTLCLYTDAHAHDGGQINEFLPGYYVTHNPTSEYGPVFAQLKPGDTVHINGETVQIVCVDILLDEGDVVDLRNMCGQDTVIFQTCCADQSGYIHVAYGYSDARSGPFPVCYTEDGTMYTYAELLEQEREQAEFDRKYREYDDYYQKVIEQYKRCMELYDTDPYSEEYGTEVEKYKNMNVHLDELEAKLEE